MTVSLIEQFENQQVTLSADQNSKYILVIKLALLEV